MKSYLQRSDIKSPIFMTSILLFFLLFTITIVITESSEVEKEPLDQHSVMQRLVHEPRDEPLNRVKLKVGGGKREGGGRWSGVIWSGGTRYSSSDTPLTPIRYWLAWFFMIFVFGTYVIYKCRSKLYCCLQDTEPGNPIEYGTVGKWRSLNPDEKSITKSSFDDSPSPLLPPTAPPEEPTVVYFVSSVWDNRSIQPNAGKVMVISRDTENRGNQVHRFSSKPF